MDLLHKLQNFASEVVVEIIVISVYRSTNILGEVSHLPESETEVRKGGRS